jgi:hypothetical protein
MLWVMEDNSPFNQEVVIKDSYTVGEVLVTGTNFVNVGLLC